MPLSYFDYKNDFDLSFYDYNNVLKHTLIAKDANTYSIKSDFNDCILLN